MADKKTFKFPVSTLIGSTFPNYLKIVNQKKVHPKYLSRFILTSLVSAILDPFGRVETSLKSKIVRKTTIDQSPIFIIGFWRSGTTYLHNLMCQDPNHAFVSTYQSIFPSHSLVNSFWMKKLATIAMPNERPVDKVRLDMDFPQEEEMGMGNMQKLSFYNVFYFPSHFKDYARNALYFNDVKKDEIDKWKDEYLLTIKKSMIMTGGKRFVSKNPPNTFRIPLLLEMFPNARFIYIYRNPYNVLSSVNLFMRQVIKGVGFQEPDSTDLENNLCSLFKQSLEKYELDKSLIPPENLFEIEYNTLVKKPIQSINDIYTQFNLDYSNDLSVILNKFNSSQKQHKSGGHFISEYLKKFISENLVDYMNQHNYSI